MSDSDSSFHGQGGNPLPDEGPSLPQRARTLLSAGGNSSLSTLSQKHPGYPFGSVMPYVVDQQGRPLFLISEMAMHTKNLRADPRSTLLVAQAAASGAELGAARISVMGETAPLIIVGLIAFVPDVPLSPLDASTVMPAQIFSWWEMPQRAFEERAALAILLLLVVLFVLNGVALVIRTRSEKRW